jgi:hypothetical protein
VASGVLGSGLGCCGCVAWSFGWVCAGGSVAVSAGGGGTVMSCTLTIGSVIPGIVIWSSGVPGGTSTLTVTWAPLSSVTSSVRWSAEAGTVATPKPTRNRPAVTRAMSSLRRCMRKSRHDPLGGGVNLPCARAVDRRSSCCDFFECNGNRALRGRTRQLGVTLAIGHDAHTLYVGNVIVGAKARADAPVNLYLTLSFRVR